MAQVGARPPAIPKSSRGAGATALGTNSANPRTNALGATNATTSSGGAYPSSSSALASTANSSALGVGGGRGGGLSNKSLRLIYDESCNDHKVHPNSLVRAMLPDRPGVAFGDEMDLSRNYIGDKGIGPLLVVVQKIPTLQRLILSDNGLRNNAVKALCAVAATHPSLSHIDLSDNYISDGAAFALLHLTEESNRIRSIEMGNTKIAADHRIRIKDRLAHNALY